MLNGAKYENTEIFFVYATENPKNPNIQIARNTLERVLIHINDDKELRRCSHLLSPFYTFLYTF